jgi:hypothetical protein
MNIKNTLKLFLPKYQKLILEYKVDMKPRYGYGKKPHQQLYEIVNSQRANYELFIQKILKYKLIYEGIKPEQNQVSDTEPYWNNGFFPAWTL